MTEQVWRNWFTILVSTRFWGGKNFDFQVNKEIIFLFKHGIISKIFTNCHNPNSTSTEVGFDRKMTLQTTHILSPTHRNLILDYRRSIYEHLLTTTKYNGSNNNKRSHNNNNKLVLSCANKFTYLIGVGTGWLTKRYTFYRCQFKEPQI